MADMEFTHRVQSEKNLSGAVPPLTFASDENLALPITEKPWSDILATLGMRAVETTDLARLDKAVEDHETDIAYIPCADYHRFFAKGDRYYRPLAIATSKFTGQPLLRALHVVRRDDPANNIDDLAGTKYGYINRSCTSSYFPPAIILNRHGKKLEDFWQITPVGAWQKQIDAVVKGDVRSTMVLEDVWKTTAKNEQDTKIIGDFVGGKPPVILARDTLDEAVRGALLDALLAWVPSWKSVYGGFKPFHYADVHAFFHALDELPPGL